MSNDIDYSELTHGIAMQLQETEEEFIYQLISPFCERIVEKKLSKKELETILRRGMQQESVLDKIRADVEGMYRVVLKDTPKDDWAVRWNDCLDEVLKIINKYSTESEVKK